MDRTKRLLSVTVLDRKHFKHKIMIFLIFFFFSERMQKSRVLDNFSPIDIMVVGKEFFISAIFYFKESWQTEAVPENWRSAILKRYKNISKQ